MTTEMRPVQPFVVTKEHRRFSEFCGACTEHRYIGLCYGPPGVGKTLSARHYAKWEAVESSIQAACSRDKARPVAELLTACRAVFYTPPVVNTPGIVNRQLAQLRSSMTGLVHQARHQHKVAKKTEDAVADFTELIIVDEADRLKVGSLEQLRDIYDRGRIGLVLVGMPGIEKRLSRYGQFYSRVGFVHQFRPLSGDELNFILTQKWQELGLTADIKDFTDAEAMATATRISGGNFRLLQRLFAQIARILDINQMRLITKEVVEAARESLVIGARA